ncbi:MAG: SMP-30/gluconolactonase/LRE family protein, partial [Candidatus Eremiobacteraeota bacterium]|nr:SMP-30/gluconolactonase/LRE family protein [Candidatus Eremiobacteraeota bacterium]
MSSAPVEVVCEARARNGECPTWSAAEGVLYWCDTFAAQLHRFDPSRRGEGAKGAPLHRIEPNGAQVAKTATVRISNGLAWSADERTMYHADTMAQEVYAYDVLDADGGILGERRTFARVETPRGGPDGAATDTDGCYWTAVYAAGKVVRFTPDGRVEREVRIPVPNVTMIAFGGADLRTAYVTSAGRPFGTAEIHA